MERKQHKRGNISKQHKSRENSRETSNKLYYKSYTMHDKLYAIKSDKSDTKAGTFIH